MKTWSFIRNKGIFIILFTIFLISVTGLSVDSVRWRTIGDNSSWVSIFQSFLFLSGLFVAFSGSRLFKDRILTTAWVFSFFCLFCALIHMKDWSIRSFIVISFNALAPALGISFGKYLMMHIQGKKQEVLSLLLLQIPTLIVGFFLLNLNGKFDSDCSFAFFIFMPLIFFFRNDFLRLLFLVFYGILILLAGKRSVTIAYIISVILYFFYYIVISRNHKKGDAIKKAILFLVAVVSIAFFISYFSPQLQTIVERFRLIDDDGGSGRNDLYKLLIDAIREGDLADLLFGHGYFSVVNDFEIGAHNDFLEIVYDYGFLALFLYILLLVRIVTKWFHSIKRSGSNSGSSLILLINIIIILVLGMLNCMFTSTYFNFVNFLALGVTLQSFCFNPSNRNMIIWERSI